MMASTSVSETGMKGGSAVMGMDPASEIGSSSGESGSDVSKGAGK
jgi:hypothetical protein